MRSGLFAFALVAGCAVTKASAYDAVLFRPMPSLGRTTHELPPLETRVAQAPTRRAPPSTRTEEFNFTDELGPDGELPGSRSFTIRYPDPAPPEFMRLSRRAREQWHACQVFMWTARPRYGNCGFGRNVTPPSLHVTFPVAVSDYLAQEDGTARRALLERSGCPAAIIDLADGTHLDIVERPAN